MILMLKCHVSGVVYCFNVDVTKSVQQSAEAKGIELHFHNIIYKLFDDIKEELTKRLPTITVDEVVGK